MRYILCMGVLVMSGCAGTSKRPPRWDVSININYSDKIANGETVTSGITIKRPIPGSTLPSVTTTPPTGKTN